MLAASMETKWIANGIHITITFLPLANASAIVREGSSGLLDHLVHHVTNHEFNEGQKYTGK